MMDVKIGDYLMSDFGLQLLSVELASPAVRQSKKEVPGRNGALDLSEALTGYPVFDSAKHKLTFDFKDGKYDTWITRSSALKGKIHGRRLPVVIGNDSHYYDARISVDTEKLNQDYSKIVVELDAGPYKLALQSSVDDWLWDTFCFETDVIRDYRDIVSTGTLTIIGDVMPTGCVFDCSEAGMTVEYEGVTYTLKKGRSSIPDILITEGEHTMTFSGDGTVSVEYRGGRF